MNYTTDLIYQLALTQVPHIGAVQARILLDHFESAAAIFKARKSALEKIEGIGTVRAAAIKEFDRFAALEPEIRFLEENEIKPLFLKDPGYPQRLLHCYDPPTLLFFKGTANLNAPKIISIIGTRNNTEYGKQLTHTLLEELTPHQPLILSGLAFGVDALAHKKSLKLQLPTVGVLAHGLHTIYPFQHAALAKEMILSGGGLLTEFTSHTRPDRHNFPTRNRIVAGMSDATVVIETAVKGGSMITVNLALGYNRDVFAVPGRITDTRSEGCNLLIQQNKAQLIRNGKDIAVAMGWEAVKKPATVQRELFIELSSEEREVVQLLQVKEQLHIDELNRSCGLNSSSVAAALLSLELKGAVQSLPGKLYALS
jgi:DNA processing protein